MANTQQRGNRARGQLPFRQLATVSSVQWTLDSETATTATILFQSPSTGIVWSPPPQLRRNNDGALPLSAVLAEGQIVVTYGAPAATGGSYTLPPNDQAIGWSNGSRLSGATTTVTGPGFPSVALLGQASNITTDVAVADVDITSLLLPTAGPQLRCTVVNPGAFATTIDVSNGATTFPVAPGEVKQFLKVAGIWTAL